MGLKGLAEFTDIKCMKRSLVHNKYPIRIIFIIHHRRVKYFTFPPTWKCYFRTGVEQRGWTSNPHPLRLMHEGQGKPRQARVHQWRWNVALYLSMKFLQSSTQSSVWFLGFLFCLHVSYTWWLETGPQFSTLPEYSCYITLLNHILHKI